LADLPSTAGARDSTTAKSTILGHFAHQPEFWLSTEIARCPKPNSRGCGFINNGAPAMDAKLSISLVSVQKPTANTPILQRRSKLIANLDQQVAKIRLYRDGKRISREQFWLDGSGTVFFQLRYGKQPLEMQKGKSTLKCSTFDDLEVQLQEVKKMAFAGDLDDALSACAGQVRTNFKVAKDKKAAKGG
jgi:hypothetical protein